MPTETMASAKDILEEKQAEFMLDLLDLICANLGIVLAIILCLVVVVFFLFPHFVRFLQNRGIKKIDEIPESEQLPSIIRPTDQFNAQITVFGAPKPDGKYIRSALPKELEALAASIEAAPKNDRFHRCVIHQDAHVVENYGRLFYKRISQISSLDHYGWLYYQKSDQLPDIPTMKSCFYEGLRIFCGVPDIEQRFIRQTDFFKTNHQHTLLVIRMNELPAENERLLSQLSSLDDLSIILFSSKPITGYETIRIP